MKIDPTNPVHKHLPAILQQETDRHDNTPPPLLIIPTKRRPGMPNKFKELTIHVIMKNIPRNLEKIIPKHTLPLWRMDTRDTQYVTRMTMNPAQRGHTKGEAANEH